MSVNVIAQNDLCFFDAQKKREDIVNFLKEQARTEADASMTSQTALFKTIELANWGSQLFKAEFEESYKQSPELKNLVQMLVEANQKYFSSDFIYGQELEKILQNKV